MGADENLELLLTRVSKVHTNKINRILEALTLHKGQPLMLMKLLKKDGVPQSLLARDMDISPATAGTMVKRLEKVGYVKRRRDSEDERISNVYLTEEGLKICARLKELQVKMDGIVFSGFSGVEKEAMKNYLNRIIANLAD
jgi:DNA-binding MarR family transcriptional regulator